MKTIEVFDNCELNAVATITLNLCSITERSYGFYFDEAVRQEQPVKSVFTCKLATGDRETISELIDEFGYDMVNNLFMDLYMKRRKEVEEECQK